MTSGAGLPRLFIGSSAESLDVAYAVQEILDFDAESTVWSQAFFRPSRNTLQELIKSLRHFDYAAFVFAPCDEYWDPPPRMAELYRRWSRTKKAR